VSDWTRAPIRSACWRVHLIAGVDRNFFWFVVLGTFAACGIGWLTGFWYVTLVLMPAAGVTLELGRRATIEDPMAPRVWLRWVFEPAYVAAVGRFDRRSVGATRRR